MLQKAWQKIKIFNSPKPWIVLLLVAGVAAAFLALPLKANASIFSWGIDSVASVLATVLLWIASILGKILVVVIDILIGVVQYNDFATADAVSKGWAVLRDLCNMFFIIVLLVIAFGTILKIENYKYNRLLAKLIIMAVLINFSKTISAFFIDLGQVVMLTFVNAFANTATGNFTSVLKLREMLNTTVPDQVDAAGSPSFMEVVGVPFLAIILLVIALMVMLAMVVVFLIRIIVLWVLVVLSPLAYLLSVLPGKAASYSSQWWQKFGQWVTIGPILAFFIWLALSVLTVGNGNMGIKPGSTEEAAGQVLSGGGGVIAAGISGVSSSENILGFILAVSMFLIALSVAGSLGGIAGAFAGKMSQRIQKMGSASIMAPLGAMKGAASAAGGWGVKRLDDSQAGLQRRFMNTRLGSAIANTKLGKAIGLEKIQEHGIQIRAIPTAWKSRKQRIEAQRLGEAPAVAEDILFRVYSQGREKTDYVSQARAARAAKAKSEIAAAGTEQEVIISRMVNSGTSKDMRVLPTKVAEAEGSLELLLGSHDFNEVLKRREFANVMTQYNNGGGKVSQEDAQNLLKHMFGDSKDTKRIAKKIEEQGLHQSDSWLKGIVAMDKQGNLSWAKAGTEDWREDKAAEQSAFFNSKLEGRGFIQKQRRQNYLTERADENNNLSFRSLSNVGKWNLQKNAENFLSTKLEHYQGEFKDAMIENLDLLVEWAEKVQQQHDNHEPAELEKSELAKLKGVIGKLAASELGLDEVKDISPESIYKEKFVDFDRDNKREPNEKEQEDLRRKAEVQWGQNVLKAVERRQGSKYWNNLHSVNDNRDQMGWSKNDDYDREMDDYARNNLFEDEDGEKRHYNPRLNALRKRIGEATPQLVKATLRDNKGDVGVEEAYKNAEPEIKKVVENFNIKVDKELAVPVKIPTDTKNIMAGSVKDAEEKIASTKEKLPDGSINKLSQSIKEAMDKVANTTSEGLNLNDFSRMIAESVTQLNEVIGSLPDKIGKELKEKLEGIQKGSNTSTFANNETQYRTFAVLGKILDTLKVSKEKASKTKQEAAPESEPGEPTT
ncbi:MAG: hypothetical protein WCV50_05115 [Patescibacteria group bacterium]|jgi:hypothetical protein